MVLTKKKCVVVIFSLFVCLVICVAEFSMEMVICDICWMGKNIKEKNFNTRKTSLSLFVSIWFKLKSFNNLYLKKETG